jgi:hypothetical protein
MRTAALTTPLWRRIYPWKNSSSRGRNQPRRRGRVCATTRTRRRPTKRGARRSASRRHRHGRIQVAARISGRPIASSGGEAARAPRTGESGARRSPQPAGGTRNPAQRTRTPARRGVRRHAQRDARRLRQPRGRAFRITTASVRGTRSPRKVRRATGLGAQAAGRHSVAAVRQLSASGPSVGRERRRAATPARPARSRQSSSPGRLLPTRAVRRTTGSRPAGHQRAPTRRGRVVGRVAGRARSRPAGEARRRNAARRRDARPRPTRSRPPRPPAIAAPPRPTWPRCGTRWNR